MDKKQRMNEVFNFLRDNGFIHTQRDLASALGSTSPNVSRMLKGDPKVLTDNICVRIQKAFPVISANWLMSGEGEMVVTDSKPISQPMPDYGSLMNAALAAKDDAIESLKREIAKVDESARRELASKDDAIESLKREIAKVDESAKRELAAKEEAISALRGQLTTKDTLIDTLQQQITDLRAALAEQQKKDSLGNYPFTIGAADNAPRPIENQ